MKISISNKEFYRKHNKELEKYLISTNSLHIINEKSKYKISEELSEKVFVNFSNDYLSQLSKKSEKFDVVILTDIVEVTKDLYNLFKVVESILKPNGKLIITSINSKWNLVVKIFEYFKLKDVNRNYSYIHPKKIENIVCGSNFEKVKSDSRQIYPFKNFGLGSLINKLLESSLYFLNLGIKTYIVFRKKSVEPYLFSRSIIIPAKNEEGNLEELFERIPNKDISQIIFTVGKSEDNTLNIVNKIKNENFNLNIEVIKQKSTGKANAVWESLKYVTSDMIAILDADISVDPETLDDFFEIIKKNNADFVNGTRLIYEMEEFAMRYLNKKGNIFFQFIVSIVIGKKLTDSLCGTKVFKKEFINKITWWQNTFQLKDPFGDFDLIFTAALTGEKIIEYPVHYRSRKYGKTQISRFRDGFKLIKYITKSFFVFNTSR